jgi:hypothetical protein
MPPSRHLGNRVSLYMVRIQNKLRQIPSAGLEVGTSASTTSMDLLALPNELLLQVLCLVPISSLSGARAACRRLHALCADRSVWRDATLHVRARLLGRLPVELPTLPFAPVLRTVHLSRNATDAAAASLSACPALTALDLSWGNQLTDAATASLMAQGITVHR